MTKINIRMLLAGVLAICLVAISAVTATSASAHTPSVTADCDGVTVNLASYQAGNENQTNHVKVTIGGDLVEDIDFETSFSETFDSPDKYKAYTYEVVVTAWDDPDKNKGWSKTFSGSVAKCDVPTGGHTPVNVCHATSSDTNPYVFITVDDDSVKFTGPNGHLMHRDFPNKTWKSDGVFRGSPVKAGDPKRDLIGDYTDKATPPVFHKYDGVITSKTDCGVLTPPVVTQPAGSFTQKCTDSGAEVTIGDLTSGTFENVVWTLTYGGTPKTVVKGDKVQVLGNIPLDLSYTSGNTTKSVQHGTSEKACPPVVTQPAGSFTQKCTDSGAEVTIGDLTSGTFENVVWTLTYGETSKTVVEGDKVQVLGNIPLDLSYTVDGGSTSHSVKSEKSKEACPPPKGDVVKTSVPATGTVVAPGSTIAYTVTVKNTGTVPITNATVVDTLPSFVTAVAGTVSDSGVVGADGRTITWTVSLAPSTTKSLTYSGLVGTNAPAGTPLVNKATFLLKDSTTTHTVGSRGLGVTKSVSPTGNAKFGDTLTYTLTVSTTGNLPQNAVVVTDQIPADTTYVAGSAACVGATCTPTLTGGVLSWPLGSMEPNTSRSVNFKVTINMSTAANAATGVTIRNSGAVQSAEVPSTPSNEVVTPVPPVPPVTSVTPAVTPVTPVATPVAPAAPVAVEGTKTGNDDSASPTPTVDDTADTEVLGTKTGGDVLAATGAGLPLSITLGLGGLLLLAGIALVSVGRPAAGRTKD